MSKCEYFLFRNSALFASSSSPLSLSPLPLPNYAELSPDLSRYLTSRNPDAIALVAISTNLHANESK